MVVRARRLLDCCRLVTKAWKERFEGAKLRFFHTSSQRRWPHLFDLRTSYAFLIAVRFRNLCMVRYKIERSIVVG
jgi:hypothetical protein